MNQVFISYKREDELFSIRLSNFLLDLGYTVWRDKDVIAPDSASWADEIQKGLEDSHTVIGVITRLAMTSENVKAEWDWAIINDRRLMLIWLEDCQIHHQYIRRQRIDFRESEHTGFQRLRLALENPNTSIEKSEMDPYANYIVAFYTRIRNLLNQSLLYALADDEPKPLNLSLDSASQHVASERKERVDPMALRLGLVNGADAVYSDFNEAFKHNNGRVLLLGNPGSGKTTTLLYYALSVAVARKQDPSQLLPIMNLITTWNGKDNLVGWLQDSYGTPENVDTLLKNGEAILLLDGLDELGNSRTEIDSDGSERQYDPRQRFLELIPQNNQILITSRLIDYEQIGDKAHLNNAFVLQPLSDTHLETALSGHPALFRATQQDEKLRELMKTPLIMALFAFAYDDIPPEKKQAIEDVTLAPLDIRDELVLAYIKRRYRWEEQRGVPLEFKLGELDPTLQDDDPRPALLPLLGQLAMENCGEFRRFGQGKIEENIFWDEDFSLLFGDDPEINKKFLNQCRSLNILQTRSDETYGFLHLFIRDTLAYEFSKYRVNDRQFFGSYAGEANPLIALGMTGKQRMVHDIGNLLQKTDDIFMQRVCLHALAYTQTQDAAIYLKSMLTSESIDIRSRVVSALKQLGGSEDIDTLISVLKDPFSRVRASAVSALGAHGGQDAIDALKATTSDVNAMVKVRALNELLRLDPQHTIPLIYEFLNDSDWYVRRDIISKLTTFVKYGDRDALKRIISAITDPVVDVRMGVVDALGEIAVPSAVDALLLFLNDPDEIVHLRAMSELKHIGTQQALDGITMWQHKFMQEQEIALQDGDSKVRCEAIKSLKSTGQIGSHLIINALQDESVYVRRQAVRELRELREPSAIPYLIGLLDDDTSFTIDQFPWRLSDYVADALRIIGTPNALKALKVWEDNQ